MKNHLQCVEGLVAHVNRKKVKLFNNVYRVYKIQELFDSYSWKNESKFIICQIGADGCKGNTISLSIEN